MSPARPVPNRAPRSPLSRLKVLLALLFTCVIVGIPLATFAANVFRTQDYIPADNPLYDTTHYLYPETTLVAHQFSASEKTVSATLYIYVPIIARHRMTDLFHPNNHIYYCPSDLICNAARKYSGYEALVQIESYINGRYNTDIANESYYVREIPYGPEDRGKYTLQVNIPLQGQPDTYPSDSYKTTINGNFFVVPGSPRKARCTNENHRGCHKCQLVSPRTERPCKVTV